jgi:hypothetical protein
MRDEFVQATIDRLAKRAGNRCSNPRCRVPTFGAAQGDDGVVNIGVAAHITAAAPGGPRYDPALTPDERRVYSNGIWLCQNHAKLVDSDEAQFTVELLRDWKRGAEQDSWQALQSPQEVSARPATPTTDEVITRIRGAAVADLAAFRNMPGRASHPIDLTLRSRAGGTERQLTPPSVASAMSAFNELVIVAPPGTGKTTTLLQIANAIVAQGESIAVFVPSAEWRNQSGHLFDSIIQRRPFESTSATTQDLKLLADSGNLILMLDGWNELDDASRTRATIEIQQLKHGFPDLGIVVSTRRQALDVPIIAPAVHIDLLSEDQQLELAKRLAGANGESLLDHAWRTPGVRELVAIPLYLTALIAAASDGAFPTTKEEIIRLFIKEHEAKSDRATELRRITFGLHPRMLTGLAIEATRSANTTISEARARSIVGGVEADLVREAQLVPAAVPNPTVILDGLISYHLLVKSNEGVAFQHQQFQEWYASSEVESLMMHSALTGHDARRALRQEILNDRSWEESILFACERLSRMGPKEVQAVTVAIQESLGIDPMLAAQMIYRSSDAVWGQIKDQVMAFASHWHNHGKVDRAAAFMISTGCSEFAADIWPLVANPDEQVSFDAIRSVDRFRPSVLGLDARDRLARLPDAVRKVVLREIASNSAMDGIELATEIAQRDGRAEVQISVIEALLFRRADRFAAAVLREAPDEVARAIAIHGEFIAHISQADVADRLRKERAGIVASEIDPLRKLALLLDDRGNRVETAAEVSSLIESAEFPGRQDFGGLSRAYQLYPNEVMTALVHRLEAGREIPYWALDVVRTTNPALESKTVADLVLRTDIPRSIADGAAIVAGSGVIGCAIDEIVEVHRTMRAKSPTIDEPTRQRFWRLSEVIANANDAAFVEALTARHGADDPVEIALLADQLARHRSHDKAVPLRITNSARQQLATLMAGWVDIVLSSPEAGRAQLADVATAIGRVASPELAPQLQRLLAEDLIRWRASRDSRSEGDLRPPDDANMSWTPLYRAAFVAIGDRVVVDLMISYLRDNGVCGFGIDAALALKESWERRRSHAPAGTQRGLPSSFGPRVAARQSDNVEATEPSADAILSVIDNFVASPSGEDQRYALRLAAVAFSMPYGERAAIILALLQLPQPPSTKLGLMKVLAEAGELLPGDVVFAGIHEILEEAKAKPWKLSSPNDWELIEWLGLLPFSDRATETINALELLPRPREPWEMRFLLSALGRSPLSTSDQLLEQLARRDLRYLDEHDWFVALSSRGSAYAARVLLPFILNGAFAGRRQDSNPLFLPRMVAAGMRDDVDLRSEVYQRYERDRSGPSGPVLEYAIAEAPDDDGVLVLIRAYGRDGKTDLGALRLAIRELAISERPSETFSGAIEEFSRTLAALRRRLFELVIRDGSEGQLASAALTYIDELRDEHGQPESEPRHPDISTDRPWPVV